MLPILIARKRVFSVSRIFDRSDPEMAIDAGVDVVQAGEAVQQRCLAAAAEPHDRDHLPSLHVQADPPENVHLHFT